MSKTALPATLVVLGAIALHAQKPPVRELGKPTAELKESFTQVRDVRELRDGRVIVLDRRELAVKLADFGSSRVTKIGRDGDGPGEYRAPIRIFALPGDSTAIHDMANGRGNVVVTPEGKPGGTLSSKALGGEGVLLEGTSQVDGRGRIYREITVVRRVGGKEVRNDSIGIEREDRASGRRDTLVLYSRHIVSPLWTDPAAVGGSSAGGRRARGQYPFASVDQWAVAPDGRVAVVSVSPYRVRFTEPSGVHHDGPPLTVDRVPVTGALKDQWRADAKRPVPGLTFSRDGSSVASMHKPNFVEPDAWPRELPAFGHDAPMFAPDGMLWVQRTHAADAPPTCDLIDPTGRIAARIVLPKSTRLVGFGAKSVYLVRIDDDDLEYLQRYRLLAR